MSSRPFLTSLALAVLVANNANSGPLDVRLVTTLFPNEAQGDLPYPPPPTSTPFRWSYRSTIGFGPGVDDDLWSHLSVEAYGAGSAYGDIHGYAAANDSSVSMLSYIFKPFAAIELSLGYYNYFDLAYTELAPAPTLFLDFSVRGNAISTIPPPGGFTGAGATFWLRSMTSADRGMSEVYTVLNSLNGSPDAGAGVLRLAVTPDLVGNGDGTGIARYSFQALVESSATANGGASAVVFSKSFIFDRIIDSNGFTPEQLGYSLTFGNGDISPNLRAAAVPEPSTLALLGTGLLSLVGYRRRAHRHGSGM